MSETPTQTNKRDGAEMVHVPAGPFLMGDDEGSEEERPRRTVMLDEYWIYKYPVTVAQYERYCRDAAVAMPQKPNWGWRHDHPIVNVSYDDALGYCTWAGVSLPTEAEWEKAARGTDGRRFPWGAKWDPDRCRCSRKDFGDAGSTAPVTAHPAGASPYGAFDMAGNVWEWCHDWYGEEYYRSASPSNPRGPNDGQYRVVRGGSWNDQVGGFFRCACRGWVGPGGRNYILGFRCVCRPGSLPLTLKHSEPEP